MKALIGTLLLIGALSAQAQSFILQNDGVLLSIDASGRVYDLSQFIPKFNLVAQGKNWLLDRDQLVTTIDAKGFVYKKTFMKGPKELKAYGDSWFISAKGEMNVVTRDGMYFSYEKDDLLRKGEVVMAGGNYLVMRRDNILTLVTVDTVKGFTYTLSPASLTQLNLNLNTFKDKGGNYFTDQTGTLFTVDKNGVVANKKDMGHFPDLRAKGSNYFVDASGSVRLVLDNGWLMQPPKSAAMGTIQKTGTTYAWDSNDKLYSFAQNASDADLSNPDPVVFKNTLEKLILQPAEQVDARLVTP